MSYPPLPQADGFTDQELHEALAQAHIPSLLAAMALLTGEDRWLEPPFAPGPAPDLGDHNTGGLPDEVLARARSESADVLRRWRDGELVPAPVPEPGRLVRLLNASLSDVLPEDYGQLLGAELGIYPRGGRPAGDTEGLEVVIIGAGASGLCLASRLAESGIPYVIVEKNDDVGGTWHENVYPGCGVDTPSHLYSLSTEPNPEWSRYFAPRDELAGYWRSIADKHGIRPNIRFSTEVVDATWDEHDCQWQVRVRDASGAESELRAAVLVSAVGLLNQPSVPAIDGADSFAGPALHTARWDRNLDLAGKRVAVIGTGASAMQFVPAAAKIAGEVRVFQRSPQWAMPHPLYKSEVPAAVHFLNRTVPYYQGWYRLHLFWRMGDRLHRLLQIDPDYPHPDRAINKSNDRLRAMLTAYIEQQLAGHPDLLAKSVPSYPVYGKRLLIDNGWYRTLKRDNVDLVTEPIDRITPAGVRTSDGRDYEADMIVYATGFTSVDILGSIDVYGRDGRSLHKQWGTDDGRAYLGITVPGFPNFFCLYGPNTNTGHGGTVIAGTEMQADYITKVLAEMADNDLASVEIRPDVFDAYDTELEAALERTIWTHPGMTTYYRNSKGRVVTNSPWKYGDYWRRTHQPDLGEYTVRPSHAPAAASDGANR